MKNQIRTIRRTGLKATLGGLALAVAVPAIALAANPFTDVPADNWYTEPVDWAYNNGITTGKTPTTFNGDDEVTRYESVTFLNRYHENVVEPALDALDADTLDGFDAGELARVAGERSEDAVDNWNGGAQKIGQIITAPTSGYLLIDYVATVTSDAQETANDTSALVAMLEIDGAEVASSFGGIDFNQSWENNFNTMTISTVVPVTAGEHAVVGTVASIVALPVGGLAYIYDRSVTVLFVPFDGSGLSPI
jgi:hypothetical protein